MLFLCWQGKSGASLCFQSPSVDTALLPATRTPSEVTSHPLQVKISTRVGRRAAGISARALKHA